MNKITDFIKSNSMNKYIFLQYYLTSSIKGRGSALLGEYKERSDRRVSGASTHPIYIYVAF